MDLKDILNIVKQQMFRGENPEYLKPTDFSKSSQATKFGGVACRCAKSQNPAIVIPFVVDMLSNQEMTAKHFIEGFDDASEFDFTDLLMNSMVKVNYRMFQTYDDSYLQAAIDHFTDQEPDVEEYFSLEKDELDMLAQEGLRKHRSQIKGSLMLVR